jgi:heptosyltransferase-3
MTRAVPARILVVALRRLGDVLLTTPLIRSLKRAHPDAAIDVLVFAGTEGILAGNPDIACVITMPARSTSAETFAFVRKLWRRYDLAFSTQSGDRPTLFAWAAGRRSVGLVGGDNVASRVKRFALSQPVETVRDTHRVREMLRLAEATGVPAVAEVVAPRGAARPGAAPERPYAVIHAVPMFRYKRWTDAGWRDLAAGLAARGLAVVATGGPGEAERRYLDGVWSGADVQRCDGVLSWPELAALIGAAAAFVGPDTSVTHLAAATGAPTVALYGPTDPRLWGPWPAGGLDTPWAASGTIQNRRNVWLVQNPQPCLPCQSEGCERRIDSHSRCMDELSVAQVLMAADSALKAAGSGARRAGGSGAQS